MPNYILTTDQARETDAAMMRAGIPGDMLMLNAAKAVADAALALSDETRELKSRTPSFVIVCGSGNNAGDGYAAAWLLSMKGASVTLVALFEPEALSQDARMHHDIALNAPNVRFVRAKSGDDVKAALESAGDCVVIDAIFGTGLSRWPEGLAQAAIIAVNEAFKPVLAVDIPSGVDGSTGQADGFAIAATWTVTFQNAKLGHYIFPGRKLTGRLIVEQIGFEPQRPRDKSRVEMITESDFRENLKPRALNAHKGDFRRALIIAGSKTMAGAAIFCAKAAAKAGAGMLTCAVPEEIADAMRVAVPESMLLPLSGDTDAILASIDEAAKTSRVVAAGPGLGKGGDVQHIIRHILSKRELSILLDADALNALGEVDKLSKNVIVTPHPGEMERLCGIYSERILRNPVEVARKFAKKWKCTVLLKGATSVIANAEGAVSLNITGNPGLARGGSGDVLSGIILALLCQGFCAYEAARCGAYLLGQCADAARSKTGECAMLPGDVIDALAPCLRGG